ncbi:hypothetical protein JTE90_009908 [Oedothorax gibbosus]|uniref:Uncharacterized protein n=1 Tax=Oedothorax gibbosus TaxID=931172 RepID=A0AAV6UW05_9ARAC|nr:hypothetical protein JTE90_009908 [Oedothorax gibbosus]
MEWKRLALAMVGHFLASLLYVLRRLRLIDAVVDSSSILEHREEIRELWEKRMMADDNQSSPSSITIETKPALEEGKEEGVTTATSESETKSEAKLSNGSAKAIENDNAEDTNANHIRLDEAKKNEEDGHATIQNGETHHDNNCADSLEEDNVEEYVESKIYTSETSLVMKSESVSEVKTEEIVQTTTVEEHASEEVPENKIAEVEIPQSEDVAQDSIDGISTLEETTISTTSFVEQVSVTESKEVSEKAIADAPENSENIEYEAPVSPKTENHHEEQPRESLDNKGIKALEIPDCTDEDGFVRIEECLPIGDNVEDIHDVLLESTGREGFEDEHKNRLANGHEDHPSSPSLPPTPDSALGDKIELEQSFKSLNKRAHVNKTEQPYSSCTTETKIAMEIREMREREEELRIMRERALTSPQPPKSPAPKEVQDPSPTPSKDQAQSPLPNGCGYRVSSVFGHKGTTSPSPSVVAEEERKAVFGKGFVKESPVEKEIRIARDREEELRKQKGLPPREDDSYVKPSQVKSSQVRVFGPVVGANNVKQAATAKIQLEIEEQTQREMALRDTGSIQTISQERTDAKVAKLNTADVTKTVPVNGQNGNSHPTNGRSSPDVAPYKRGSPSPNGGINVSRPASIFSQTNGSKTNGGISMHKFISSKGKEATFAAPVRNGSAPFAKEEPRASVMPPNMVKLKRTVSVESKIQQEIMEMKQREEELKLLHMNRSNDNLSDQDIMEHEMNQKNNFVDYENDVNNEDLSPRHNKLIAQWEQRIQKAES